MAKKSNAEGAPRYLQVKQIRSGVGRPETHRRTLRALGLRHHQATVQVVDNEATRGMLFQVRHLVEVSEAETPKQSAPRAAARKRAASGAGKGEEK